MFQLNGQRLLTERKYLLSCTGLRQPTVLSKHTIRCTFCLQLAVNYELGAQVGLEGAAGCG